MKPANWAALLAQYFQDSNALGLIERKRICQIIQNRTGAFEPVEASQVVDTRLLPDDAFASFGNEMLVTDKVLLGVVPHQISSQQSVPTRAMVPMTPNTRNDASCMGSEISKVAVALHQHGLATRTPFSE